MTSAPRAVDSEAIACPLCRGATSALHPLKHTTVRSCGREACGLRFAAPQPGETELGLAYRSLYYPDEQATGAEAFEDTPALILTDLVQSLVERMGGIGGLGGFGGRERARLLDFGCGRGALGRIAHDLGLDAVGIEQDAHARAFASREARMQVFESASALIAAEPRARFDVITMWQVIEHLREPWTELMAVRELLKPEGFLVVATPNAACLKAKLQEASWENFANPTHLYYFTEVSLRRVLGTAGFANVQRLQSSSAYPHHGLLRRGAQRLLRWRGLDGDLVFVAWRGGS